MLTAGQDEHLKIFPQQIKIINLMKIIVEAQWIIDEDIFSEMLSISGYLELMEDFKKTDRKIKENKQKISGTDLTL